MSVKEPISLKDLMEDGVIFTVNSDEVPSEADNETEEDQEYQKKLLNFMNMQIAGGEFQDEDSYINGQPFEVIASKMINLTENGAVKKRIIRDGYGEKPQDSAIVRVEYNAYIEYNAEPFDSTYARGRQHQFCVNCGEVIIGLDIAVQSMKINEKSQFIIQPIYAYGQLGCLQRVPANTEVLFEVELKQIVDVSAATRFDTLPSTDQKKFSYVYDYCLALCAKGKDIYSKNVNGAIREYNSAVAKLEMCQLDSYEDQEKHQELLLRLYSNLLVAYTKIEEPKKGCINFNKITELVKGTDIKVTAKMYYNNSKCLRMLGEFHLAKKRLQQAKNLEPKNPEILNEMIALDQDIKESKQKDIQLAKAFVASSKDK